MTLNHLGPPPMLIATLNGSLKLALGMVFEHVHHDGTLLGVKLAVAVFVRLWEDLLEGRSKVLVDGILVHSPFLARLMELGLHAHTHLRLTEEPVPVRVHLLQDGLRGV